MNKILVMDEDAAIQMLYSDELFDEGYEVFTCGKPTRVMELIGQIDPDLLLMDVRVDGNSGLNLLQGIKKRYPLLPVILCTGYPAYNFDVSLMNANDYLVKSSNLQELKSKIGKILNGSNPLDSVDEIYEAKQTTLRESVFSGR